MLKDSPQDLLQNDHFNSLVPITTCIAALLNSTSGTTIALRTGSTTRSGLTCCLRAWSASG